ncbi:MULTISPECIES: 30S ribosomal protein S13 [Halomicrobium]|uniref:Small ribosomal subunit protein uS13 n=2 Tax=Halomicrobium mukohataei TaxID=57705 RepID=C7NZ06_HALMD|nr:MULTISPECIES: 30S ribosomal protein S13 [Halomicrobium]ACV48695.1 ribosomal protein S13 [Halomicrobium mukohataei DSM 12286]MBO4246403.1 30S ribosomal protein S13 [Halomicrobium sp. IBSBa]NLV10920.1 30S ribosomal protein S13 [Halomicrobium mukohataei]QCD64127.1 30S ribosomal protein S13 [Halomicrobium mukohataei]QFR18933.1 30S ribosomal protein S13 [Halomicrobium sp. ZPS1]
MSAEEPELDEDVDEEELRYFVRIGQTDLDGTKSVERSLTDMNGIGKRAARIIAEKAGVDRQALFGALDDEDIEAVVEKVEGYADEVPEWLTNHQNDFYSGETTHEIGNDLQMQRRADVNRMQMIDSYKGVRHKRGQKVRGQRTKSTGRTEGTIGVNVEAIKEEQAEEAAAEEDEGGEE